jgi:cyclic pyranopterin phosphate synthase
MPPDGVCPLFHGDVLTYEEINKVVQAAAALGINKLRITGGEPLVRLGLPKLIRMLARIDVIDDISLTTNGVLLSRYAVELKRAGLQRVNVSLDTLKQDKFEFITRGSNNLVDVLEGIKVSKSIDLNPVKINMVVMSGVNDDEILDFGMKTIEDDWNVRFIELMPFGSKSDTTPQFMPAVDIKKRLELLGKLEPYLPGIGNGPAKYFRFPNTKGTIGFISPVSEHFCFNCNRLRLTSDGKFRLCLLAEDEIDLKQPLRSGISPDGLKQLIERAVANKPLRHHLAEGDKPKQRPMTQVGG